MTRRYIILQRHKKEAIAFGWRDWRRLCRGGGLWAGLWNMSRTVVGREYGGGIAVPVYDLSSNFIDNYVLQCYSGGKINCSTEQFSYIICLTKILYSLFTLQNIWGTYTNISEDQNKYIPCSSTHHSGIGGVYLVYTCIMKLDPFHMNCQPKVWERKCAEIDSWINTYPDVSTNLQDCFFS